MKKSNTKIVVLSVVAISLVTLLGYKYSQSSVTVDTNQTAVVESQADDTNTSLSETKPTEVKAPTETVDKNRDYTDDENKFYAIIKKTNDESKEYAQTWQEALEYIRAPEILDPEALTSLEIYDDQKEIIKDFKQKTDAYKEYHDKMMEELEKSLSDIDNGSPLIHNAIVGNKIQGPMIDELLSEHNALADIMLELLDLMKTDHGKWKYEDDRVVFSTDSMEQDYDRLGKEFVNKVMKIEQMNRVLMGGGRQKAQQESNVTQ